jgi:hypothetical protein
MPYQSVFSMVFCRVVTRELNPVARLSPAVLQSKLERADVIRVSLAEN